MSIQKKEMLINVLQPEECRIAVVEDGVLEELYVERTSLESYTGNIYKGRVVNIEPAIQAAFVDFSVGRNGFLHVSDVEPRYYEDQLDDETVLSARDRGRDPRRNRDRDETSENADNADNADAPSSSRRSRSRSGPPKRGRDRDKGKEREHARDRESTPDQAQEDEFASDAFGAGLGFDSDIEAQTPPAKAEAEAETSGGFGGESETDDDNEEGRRTSWPKRRKRGRRRSESSSSDADRAPSSKSASPKTRDDDRSDDDGGKEKEEDTSDLSAENETEGAPSSPRRRGRSRGRERIRERGRGGGGRERPERSEKGQPDRSVRSFGEGLIDNDEPPPSPRPEATPPPNPKAPTTRPSTSRFTSSSSDSTGRSFGSGLVESEPPRRKPPLPDDDESDEGPPSWRAEALPEPEDYEPYLPPSRTQRSRSTSRRSRSESEDVPSWKRRSRAQDEQEQEDEPTDTPATPSRQGDDSESQGSEDAESFGSSSSRRRGSRDSGRSRGSRRSDRRRGRSKPSEGFEDDDRDRDRSASASEQPEGDAGSQPRRHDRAGEPGYVPRRERASLFDSDSGDDWGDTGPADQDDSWRPAPEPFGQDQDFEKDSSDEEDDHRGRRGRSRRRRRDRDDSPASSPRSERASDFSSPPPAVAVDPFELEDPELDEEIEDDTAAPARSPDDEIDPELREEIAREIEEIRLLEREIGLPRPPGARAKARGKSERPEPASRGGRRATDKPPVQEVFQRGDEVLIQVIKESIGTKGPTLSTYISIPGRYLVLMPGLNRVGVSRKISDEGQRRKLRKIMHELNPPQGLGFIVRTAGVDRTKGELARDLAYLLRLWKVILKRIKKANAPAPIYQESDMIIRTIRDIFNSDIDTIWIDERSAFERAREFLKVVMPKYVDRLKFYNDKAPLFHKYGLEEEINKIQRRQVPLPEGGSIVIDQTEALVAIDVNSGNFRVEDNAEKTAYEMNLRAAREIARQLRLRDLGGVIVNDFIDMREERHRRGVERALREAVRRDRARTKVLRMSQFGLIEMTRQRIRPSLKRSVYANCEHCGGAGLVKTVESMAIDVMRAIAFASHRGDVREIHVGVCEDVATFINNRKRQDLAVIEAESGLSIQVVPVEGATREHLVLSVVDVQGNDVTLLPAPAPPSDRSSKRRRDRD